MECGHPARGSLSSETQVTHPKQKLSSENLRSQKKETKYTNPNTNMKHTLVNTVSIAIFGFAMTAAPLTAAEHGHDHGAHAHKEAHADHMLEGYAVVANALYKEDLATAKKAAAGIVKHDKKSALAAPASKLSKAKSLDDARKAFNDLSSAAIGVAKKEKGYKVAHCPMANGNKGGDWLQKSSDKKVNNPYFGAKMPHCGSFKK